MASVVIPLATPVVRLALTKLTSFVTTEVSAFNHVKDEIETLKNTLTEIQAVLTRLEAVQQSSSMEWFNRLRVAAYDADDLIYSWATRYLQWSMKKEVQIIHLPFSTSNFLFQYLQSRKLRKIIATLNKILEDGQRYKNITDTPMPTTGNPSQSQQTGSVSSSLVVSREEDKEKIIRLLTTDEESSDGQNISFIPIVGMGGLGKTTLAQLVYNDDRMNQTFETKIWVCVTDNFDIKRIFREIVMSQMSKKIIGHDANSISVDKLETHAKDILAQKRFLLVLDDLWTYNHVDLEPLEKILVQGGRGSKVLVTSRISEISNLKYSKSAYFLQCLGDTESWSLFQNIAFKEHLLTGRVREELEVYGKEIVSKCKGLPLAVKQMGGLLCGNTDVNRWKNIKSSQTWEVGDDRVLPALRLSYDHLLPNHKQCFAYCSLFPKAYVYEKDELVKLWMAEALIEPNNRERTEVIGSTYLKELSNRFFFEREDETKYRMHDVIHDLAQEISSPFCCQVKDKKDIMTPNFNEKSRHVSLLSEEIEQPTLEIIKKSKKLRTLILPVQHLKAFGKVQHEIFHSLRYMRTLDLSSSTIQTLPESIEKLRLLHYLDLSKTEITALPDSICKLYNLQTLKLLQCPWLFNLPTNLKTLVNLRHLELDEMFWYKASMLPRSIGCLTSLHNLHKFQVGCKTGYKLEELKNMEYLTGTLHISKLENATNAEEANLKEKELIEKVIYEWSNSDLNLQDEATEKQVLEDIQPHSRVKELQICHYRSTEFPIWMRGRQLQNLVNIELNHCTRITILSLGELPHLKEVILNNMLELKEWQEETYQSLEVDKWKEETYQPLRILKISGCPKLTKLPCCLSKLTVLEITRCESLETIPFGPVMFITLVDNPVLKHWTREDLEVTIISDDGERQRVTADLSSFSAQMINVKIINCPELNALPRDLYPQKLEIGGCRSLSDLPDEDHSVRLQHLALDACHEDTLVTRIPAASILQSLVISNITNLICLPTWPSLPSLQALYIRDCEDLEYLSSQENRMFERFTCLKVLSIQNCPKLVALPVEGLPTSLQYLRIGSCAMLQSFGPPDVLQKLGSLNDLYIEDCPALLSLPDNGLSTALLHLSIKQCPLLIERCGQEDGDLPKIRDIPDLEIQKPTTGRPTSAALYHLPRICGGHSS
ncbi:disease resistance protein RGA2 isoform X2 [Rosa chinensis]|uniref:disease resistance protein RGA2 isoform X2 n=1 Tax=Rosa chinensis TaxID=74649 RepID=UPI000D08E1E3|nr:disease resistance protein RGA2 isoform X2 [Rosa chinensis]